MVKPVPLAELELQVLLAKQEAVVKRVPRVELVPLVQLE
jgi:hypothetical protein